MWKIKKGPQGQKPATQLVQCWFPGAHVNVGGGSSNNVVDEKAQSKPKGDAEQLATITYAWMLDRIRPHLALDQDALNVQFAPFDKMKTHDTPDVPAKAPSRGMLMSTWDYFFAPAKPLLTGYARGHIDDSFTAQYWLMGTPINRRPGKYHNVDEEFTTERIHPSVFFRQEATKKFGDQSYTPFALQGWERVKDDKGIGRDGKVRKGWKWVKSGGEQDKQEFLWEFQIGDMPEGLSMEKRLMEGSWVDPINLELKQGWA